MYYGSTCIITVAGGWRGSPFTLPLMAGGGGVK